MPTAITHDPSFTTPVSSTNTALVRWSGTGGDTVLDTSGILSNGSSITLNARGEVRFADADSSHYIALESPATVSTSYTMTLPAAVPSANDYLKVTSYSGGAGVLEWATATTAAHSISSHTDVARSMFIPVMGAHIGQNFTTADGGRFHALRAADGADCRATFTSRVPDDFVSFTNVKMIWKTPASSGNLVFRCYFYWATEDQSITQGAETGDTQTVATGGNEVLNYDEAGNFALSGIAKGDLFGSDFRCYRNNASDTISNYVEVVGFEFNYVASQ